MALNNLLQNAFNIVIFCFLKYNFVLKLFSGQDTIFVSSFTKKFFGCFIVFSGKNCRSTSFRWKPSK